jgi:nicotinamidase-related amidase
MDRIDPSSTALVVIDVQNDYFPGGRFVLFRAKAALRQTLILRDWARRTSIPIFWIRHISRKAGSFFLLPGSQGAELHPALGPLASELVVEKDDPNSFVGTGLEAQLRGRGIDTVVWAGMIGWMCVDTTVRSAKDRGFCNLLAYDAVASGWLKGPYGLVTPWSAHRAFLSALGFYHSRLRSTRSIVELPLI